MGTPDDHVELVQKGYAAFSSGDLAALGEIMAPDVVHSVPGSNLTSGEYSGQDEVFGLYAKLFELSDGTFRIELVSATPIDDDRVEARHHSTATRAGRSIDTHSTIVFTIADGKAARLDERHDDQALVDEFWS